jgi:hypothetical protein
VPLMSLMLPRGRRLDSRGRGSTFLCLSKHDIGPTFFNKKCRAATISTDSIARARAQWVVNVAIRRQARERQAPVTAWLGQFFCPT